MSVLSDTSISKICVKKSYLIAIAFVLEPGNIHLLYTFLLISFRPLFKYNYDHKGIYILLYVDIPQGHDLTFEHRPRHKFLRSHIRSHRVLMWQLIDNTKGDLCDASFWHFSRFLSGLVWITNPFISEKKSGVGFYWRFTCLIFFFIGIEYNILYCHANNLFLIGQR